MKHTNKKASSLALNMVIIAVIAIVVLVVILFIFYRGSGDVNEGVNQCSGECVTANSEGKCPLPGQLRLPGDCGENKVCCPTFGERS